MGLDGLPAGGSQPLTPDPSSPANTGSHGRSFQAVFLLAPTGACRPRQADRSVPSPLPHPTCVYPGAVDAQGLGASWGFSHIGSVWPALCESLGWTHTRCNAHSPCLCTQGECSLQRTGIPGSKTPANQEWHRIIPLGISKAPRVLVRACLTDVPRPFSCVSGGRRCSINLEQEEHLEII